MTWSRVALGSGALFVVTAVVFLAAAAEARGTLGGTIDLGRDEKRRIETDTTITAPVILRDNAELTIRGAEVTVLPGRGAPAATIDLHDRARLIIDDAVLRSPAETPGSLTIRAHDDAELTITKSVVLDTLEVGDGATFTITDTQVDGRALAIPESAGAYGTLRVSGRARGSVRRSTLNAIDLVLSANDAGTVRDLRPGRVTTWNSQDIGSVGFSVRLEETDLLPPLPGAYPRGWSLTVPARTSLTVSNVELGALTITEITETFAVSHRTLQKPTTETFGSLALEEVTVHTLWGLAPVGATGTIADSEGISLAPSGSGTILVRSSTLKNLAPRSFTGTLVFDDATWEGRGAFVGENAFSMSGTLRVDPALRSSITWVDTTVTRVYPTEQGVVAVRFTDDTYQDRVPGAGGTSAAFSFFDSTDARDVPEERTGTLTGVVLGALAAGVAAAVGAVWALALRRKRLYPH